MLQDKIGKETKRTIPCDARKPKENVFLFYAKFVIYISVHNMAPPLHCLLLVAKYHILTDIAIKPEFPKYGTTYH